MVINAPSSLVSVNPWNGSLNVGLCSRSTLIATASPSFIASVASERQCTPAMLRPWAIFDAILFSSPPTVRSGPSYGISPEPSLLGTTGFGIIADSSNHAFRTVTQAPATVEWPEPYDVCSGDPSGKAIGNR